VVAATSRISGIEAGCGHFELAFFSKYNTARLSVARYFLYNCNVTDVERGFQHGGKMKQDEEYLLFFKQDLQTKGAGAWQSSGT